MSNAKTTKEIQLQAAAQIVSAAALQAAALAAPAAALTGSSKALKAGVKVITDQEDPDQLAATADDQVSADGTLSADGSQAGASDAVVLAQATTATDDKAAAVLPKSDSKDGAADIGATDGGRGLLYTGLGLLGAAALSGGGSGDTTPPVAPALALATDSGSSASDKVTNSNVVNVSGLEAGATWQYSIDGGTTWTAGSGSSFTVSGDGEKTVWVRQTDGSGNVSANSAPLSFTLDTTVAKTNAALTNDSGTSASDAYTNDAAMTAPTNTEAGATLEFKINSGDWSTTYVAPTVDGDYTVSVRQTDVAGNVSALQTVSFKLDTTIAKTDAALTVDSGSSGDDGYTNNAAMTGPTNVESGAVVEFKINEGEWSTTYVAPEEDGDYTVSVRQTDGAGNVSEVQTVEFTLDTVVAVTDAGLTNDSGSSDSDFYTNDAAMTAPTNVETAAEVEYKINGGAWSASYVSPTVDGLYTVLVKQTDLAGNESVQTVGFTLDKTNPGAPAALTYVEVAGSKDAVRISGSYDGGSLISLNAVGTVETKPLDGTWSVDVSTEFTGALLITATDLAGNIESTAGSVYIGNATANTFNAAGSSPLWMFGLEGNDQLTGSAGNDRIYGGDGNDTLTDDGGNDFLSGGAGNDIINLSSTFIDASLIDLRGITSSADRDVINGFSFNDVVLLDSLSNLRDLSVNQFNGNTKLNGDALGAKLLQEYGTFSIQANESGYLLAYDQHDNGQNSAQDTAFLYSFNDANGDDVLAASEIQLIATFNGVTTGSLTIANFATSEQPPV